MKRLFFLFFVFSFHAQILFCSVFPASFSRFAAHTPIEAQIQTLDPEGKITAIWSLEGSEWKVWLRNHPQGSVPFASQLSSLKPGYGYWVLAGSELFSLSGIDSSLRTPLNLHIEKRGFAFIDPGLMEETPIDTLFHKDVLGVEPQESIANVWVYRNGVWHFWSPQATDKTHPLITTLKPQEPVWLETTLDHLEINFYKTAPTVHITGGASSIGDDPFVLSFSPIAQNALQTKGNNIWELDLSKSRYLKLELNIASLLARTITKVEIRRFYRPSESDFWFEEQVSQLSPQSINVNLITEHTNLKKGFYRFDLKVQDQDQHLKKSSVSVFANQISPLLSLFQSLASTTASSAPSLFLSRGEVRDVIVEISAPDIETITTVFENIATTTTSLSLSAPAGENRQILVKFIDHFSDVIRVGKMIQNIQPSPDGSRVVIHVENEPLPLPSFSVFPHSKATLDSVIPLSISVTDGTLFYTLDGKSPKDPLSLPQSTDSQTNINLTNNTKLRFFVQSPAGKRSGVYEEEYIFTHLPVAIISSSKNPLTTDSYADFVTISYNCDLPGSVLYLSENASGFTSYNHLPVSRTYTQSTSASFYFVSPYGFSSSLTEKRFLIEKTPTALFSAHSENQQKNGTFLAPATFTLNGDTPNTTVFYTLDGSLPNSTSQSAPAPLTLTLSQNATLKFFVRSPHGLSSIINTQEISIEPAPISEVFWETPPVMDAWTESVDIFFQTTPQNSLIYYTLDGTTPSTHSAVVAANSAIHLTTSTKLNWFTLSPAGFSSQIYSRSFQIHPYPTVSLNSSVNLLEFLPQEGLSFSGFKSQGSSVQVFVDDLELSNTSVTQTTTTTDFEVRIDKLPPGQAIVKIVQTDSQGHGSTLTFPVKNPIINPVFGGLNFGMRKEFLPLARVGGVGSIAFNQDTNEVVFYNSTSGVIFSVDSKGVTHSLTTVIHPLFSFERGSLPVFADRSGIYGFFTATDNKTRLFHLSSSGLNILAGGGTQSLSSLAYQTGLIPVTDMDLGSSISSLNKVGNKFYFDSDGTLFSFLPGSGFERVAGGTSAVNTTPLASLGGEIQTVEKIDEESLFFAIYEGYLTFYRGWVSGPRAGQIEVLCEIGKNYVYGSAPELGAQNIDLKTVAPMVFNASWHNGKVLVQLGAENGGASDFTTPYLYLHTPGGDATLLQAPQRGFVRKLPASLINLSRFPQEIYRIGEKFLFVFYRINFINGIQQVYEDQFEIGLYDPTSQKVSHYMDHEGELAPPSIEALRFTPQGLILQISPNDDSHSGVEVVFKKIGTSAGKGQDILYKADSGAQISSLLPQEDGTFLALMTKNLQTSLIRINPATKTAQILSKTASEFLDSDPNLSQSLSPIATNSIGDTFAYAQTHSLSWTDIAWPLSSYVKIHQDFTSKNRFIHLHSPLISKIYRVDEAGKISLYKNLGSSLIVEGKTLTLTPEEQKVKRIAGGFLLFHKGSLLYLSDSSESENKVFVISSLDSENLSLFPSKQANLRALDADTKKPGELFAIFSSTTPTQQEFDLYTGFFLRFYENSYSVLSQFGIAPSFLVPYGAAPLEEFTQKPLTDTKMILSNPRIFVQTDQILIFGTGEKGSVLLSLDDRRPQEKTLEIPWVITQPSGKTSLSLGDQILFQFHDGSENPELMAVIGGLPVAYENGYAHLVIDEETSDFSGSILEGAVSMDRFGRISTPFPGLSTTLTYFKNDLSMVPEPQSIVLTSDLESTLFADGGELNLSFQVSAFTTSILMLGVDPDSGETFPLGSFYNIYNDEDGNLWKAMIHTNLPVEVNKIRFYAQNPKGISQDFLEFQVRQTSTTPLSAGYADLMPSRLSDFSIQDVIDLGDGSLGVIPAPYIHEPACSILQLDQDGLVACLQFLHESGSLETDFEKISGSAGFFAYSKMAYNTLGEAVKAVYFADLTQSTTVYREPAYTLPNLDSLLVADGFVFAAYKDANHDCVLLIDSLQTQDVDIWGMLLDSVNPYTTQTKLFRNYTITFMKMLDTELYIGLALGDQASIVKISGFDTGNLQRSVFLDWQKSSPLISQMDNGFAYPLSDLDVFGFYDFGIDVQTNYLYLGLIQNFNDLSGPLVHFSFSAPQGSSYPDQNIGQSGYVLPWIGNLTSAPVEFLPSLVGIQSGSSKKLVASTDTMIRFYNDTLSRVQDKWQYPVLKSQSELLQTTAILPLSFTKLAHEIVTDDNGKIFVRTAKGEVWVLDHDVRFHRLPTLNSISDLICVEGQNKILALNTTGKIYLIEPQTSPLQPQLVLDLSLGLNETIVGDFDAYGDLILLSRSEIFTIKNLFTGPQIERASHSWSEVSALYPFAIAKERGINSGIFALYTDQPPFQTDSSAYRFLYYIDPSGMTLKDGSNQIRSLSRHENEIYFLNYSWLETLDCLTGNRTSKNLDSHTNQILGFVSPYFPAQETQFYTKTNSGVFALVRSQDMIFDTHGNKIPIEGSQIRRFGDLSLYPLNEINNNSLTFTPVATLENSGILSLTLSTKNTEPVAIHAILNNKVLDFKPTAPGTYQAEYQVEYTDSYALNPTLIAVLSDFNLRMPDVFIKSLPGVEIRPDKTHLHDLKLLSASYEDVSTGVVNLNLNILNQGTLPVNSVFAKILTPTPIEIELSSQAPLEPESTFNFVIPLTQPPLEVWIEEKNNGQHVPDLNPMDNYFKW